jgi:hypothetical protein
MKKIIFFIVLFFTILCFTINAQRITSEWGQSRNNGGGCNPSFNEYLPPNNDCRCDRYLSGCGNIAMSQIINYWEFPCQSSFGAYDYDNLTDELFDGSNFAIPILINDCYISSFSFKVCEMLFGWISSATATTVSSIASGLNDDFKFKAAKKVTKESFPDEEWHEMISYITNNHPVIYRADVDLTAKHTFIIDSYNSTSDEFFVNWGWRGNDNDWYALDDLNPGDGAFNKNEMAIVGLTPTCSQVPLNITDLSYSSIDGRTENLHARNDISLPSTNENLNVNNNGKLILTSGNKIILNAGFSVELGSEFKTRHHSLCNGYTNDNITITMATECNNNNNDPYIALVQNGEYVVVEIIVGSGQVYKKFFAPVVSNQATLFTGNDISSLSQAWYTLRYTVFNYYGTKHEGTKQIFVL